MQFNQEYRLDPAISQSDLKTFESDIIRFYNQKILGIVQETKSDPMDVGSIIDAILLDPEELKRYYVVTDLRATGKVKEVVDLVWYFCCNSPEAQIGDSITVLKDYQDHIIKAITQVEYQGNWKLETRIAKIISEGSEYFDQLKEAKGLYMVGIESWNLAHSTVNDIKEDPFTTKIFEMLRGENVPEHIRVEKKVLLKGEFEGTETKGEVDFLIIDTKAKIIQPWDLKTTRNHAHFRTTYRSRKYGRQGSFYTELIRQNYPGYAIHNFQFLVLPTEKDTTLPDGASHEHPEVYEMRPGELYIHAEGYTFDSGYKENGWKSLIREIQWHFKTGNWAHRKSYYEEGCNYIDSKINLDEVLTQQQEKELY